MRTVVTGGAGFIGRNLCQRLLQMGDTVSIIDDFTSGSEENVRQLMRQSELVYFLHHNVCRPYSAMIGADRIFNLACSASPVVYQRDPFHTMRTNVMGMFNAVEFAKMRGIPLLQASTSEVYGDPTEHPQREGYCGNVNTMGPRACYDEGKRAAEAICFDAACKGMDVKVARIFNTYGPHMRVDDGRMVPNFICAALRGEPLLIHGHGMQTRSLCYIDDLVNGLLILMATPHGYVGPVNLGNPTEISVLYLAIMIREITGSKSKLEHIAAPKDDPRRRCPNIGEARCELGWEPRVGLQTGLEKTVAYFDQVIAKAA